MTDHPTTDANRFTASANEGLARIIADMDLPLNRRPSIRESLARESGLNLEPRKYGALEQ